MASAPPQATDPVAAFIVSVISGLVNGVEIPVVEATAEAQLPLLAAPVFKQVFEFVVEELSGMLAIEAEGLVLKVVFRIEQNSKLYGVVGAALALQKANQSGDPNAISQATQNAVDHWGNLIHWGGTAPVAK